MANTRPYYRSFAGGEISPEMFGRIDDAKFQNGAAKMLNFAVAPTGAARNRPGFAYVNSTKNNGVARLISFTYSLNQTMVIELGNQYARFHTLGETLEYTAVGTPAWVAPSGTIGYSLTTPGVITWAGHGLTTGDPIRFYVYGSSTPPALPGGMQLAYTYTVVVIDANTFTLLDASGSPVALTGTAIGGTPTVYAGSGSTSVSLSLAPNQSSNATSSTLGGLASTPVSLGIATLNADIDVSIYESGGAGTALFEYSTDGVHWEEFYGAGNSETSSVSASIPIANLDLLQLRVVAGGGTGPSGSVSVTGEIVSWSATVWSGSIPGAAPLRAYRYYLPGDAVSYGGATYAAAVADNGGLTTPGTNAQVWFAQPLGQPYEIPTPFLAADLFQTHYVQSMDVMTLVHPNYPPQELRRLGAMKWTLTPIDFGPPLPTPQGVGVTASPGYLAQISTVTNGGGNALITTASNHTLALGDGVYVATFTYTPISGPPQVLDGFYMVSEVPVDGSGNLIPDELYLMDYSGNNLAFGSGTYSSGGTIQFGTKIFNITSVYAVQAIGTDGVSAGALSAQCSVLNNLDVPGSYNTIAWDAAAGSASYNVYKQLNGLWGFIGNTQALTFADNNIAPDMGITPGTPDPVFSGPGNYPGAVSYFQQRRCFAGSGNDPDRLWMTNSGTESMVTYSLPSLDTDRISIRVAALRADVIQHLVPMLQLILLTSESEFALTPGGTNAVTPSTVSVNAQSYIGASQVQPTIINVTMVYAAARGGHVRELGYAWTVNGYSTGDLSLRAAHLFDTFTIVDQAYSKSPFPIVWFVSSSGKLLGLTYIPEEQLGAWHQHETEGVFESIACVAEGSDDVLYAVINRTINGNTVRYVERMASLVFDGNIEDAFYVDAGATQTFGSPVSEISGLTWLEGATVAVLADGGVQKQKVVTGGSITLDHAASVVQVGLPYVSDLETLPAVLQIDGFGQGRAKNINKAWVRVVQSSGILVGPDEDHLVEVSQRMNEPWGSPPDLKTGEVFILESPEWQAGGQTLIRQQNPLPLIVAGLTLEVAIGG
jgi:hypothetical protein